MESKSRQSDAPEMSTRWWEVVERMQRKPGDTTFPFPRVKAEYAEHRAYAELAHVSDCGVLLMRELICRPSV